MKVRNKKLRGGANPTLICDCGKQINPQAAGLHPVSGFGAARRLYCASDCGYYTATIKTAK